MCVLNILSLTVILLIFAKQNIIKQYFLSISGSMKLAQVVSLGVSKQYSSNNKPVKLLTLLVTEVVRE